MMRALDARASPTERRERHERGAVGGTPADHVADVERTAAGVGSRADPLIPPRGILPGQRLITAEALMIKN